MIEPMPRWPGKAAPEQALPYSAAGVKRLRDGTKRVSELLLSNHEWRLQAQNVAKLAAHADEHSGLAADSPDACCLCGRRLFVRSILHQFNANHQPLTSHVSDQFMPLLQGA